MVENESKNQKSIPEDDELGKQLKEMAQEAEKQDTESQKFTEAQAQETPLPKDQKQTIDRIEEARDALEKKSWEVYATGENFEKFLSGLGVKSEQLSDEEKQGLQLFAQHAGEHLLDAALRQKGVEYKNTEDVLLALEKHAESLFPFARHDLIHAMIAYKVNSDPKADPSRKDSLVPEFLRPNISGSQAVIEELPATLWTEVQEVKKPMIAVMMEGRSNELFYFLKKDHFREVVDPVALKQLEEEVTNLDRSDFESFIKGYANFTFYLVKVFSKLTATQSENFDDKKWEGEYNLSWDKARKLFDEELASFTMDIGKESIGSETKRRTLKLFLEKSKSIFDGYDKNPKVLMDEFMSLGKPLLERLPKGKKETKK